MRTIRHDEMMPGDDALTAARAELYALDPEDFTKRRGELATLARQDGDATAARAITGLRRPTKAAWLINRLARAEPEVVAGIAELGNALRAAQLSLDGARLRELTQQRRKLIAAASRRAFDVAGQPEPPQSLRDEVTSTLEAALADPDVAKQFSAGTLVRSAHWSGFGDSTPTLTAVPARPAGRRPATPSTPVKRVAAKSTGPERADRKGASTTQDSARDRHSQQVSQAEDALAAASRELDSATAAEREHDAKVGQRSEQLADARRRQDEARLDTRRARTRHRDAERKLQRIRRRSP